MTYEEIRSEAAKEKRSHFNECMTVSRFGEFSVCQSDKTTIIVDTVLADVISRRKWCVDSQGYAMSRFSGESVRLHDFVMAMTHRSKPCGMFVDHINRDRMDNRLRNLRFVTPQENTLNLSLRSTNKSGVTGVCRSKNGRYRAYIKYGGKQVNLGYYDTLEEAKTARIEGEQRFGYTKPATVLQMCNLAFLAELEKENFNDIKR